MLPQIFNRVAKSIGILDQNRNVSENESVLAVYLDVDDSFWVSRVGAQDVAFVVEEKDGAVLLGLVLLVLVLHVLCEELQLSLIHISEPTRPY